MNAFAIDLGKLALGEIRHLQIVEQQIDKLGATENEPEAVLAVAFARAVRLAAALPLSRQQVAFDQFLVSGKHPRAARPPPAPGGGSKSPSTNFLFPGSTMSRVPPSQRKRGSFMPSSGTLISPP